MFAQHGYRVVLAGRRTELLELAQAALTEAHHNYNTILTLDVRTPDAIKEALLNLPAEFADIDILINNAGLAKGLSPIHEGSFDHWDQMIDTNIKGLLYVTRLVAPAMVARRKGHIINIGSTAGKEVYPSGNVYCATKFAVDALTKAMRQDLFTHGIRVSQVSPGHVEGTEFAVVRFDGDTDRANIYEHFKPLHAEDVARVIYFVITQPPHVNIQDVLLMSTQQAGAQLIDRSGR
jgi:NADP-dependent 3-hydroxy acid dehydrogenase YdfG